MKPDEIILSADGRQVTLSQFNDRVARAAAMLAQMGIGRGDCIGVALRNCPAFFELLMAAGAIGAKTAPIAWRLKREEVKYLVEDSGAKLVIHDEESGGQMQGLPAMSLAEYERRLASTKPAGGLDPASSRPQMELYSSGTTGRPKAIERDMSTDPAKLASMASLGFLDMMGVAEPGEVHMMCGPLYHSQPIGFATGALAAGHRVVMMGGSFDAENCLATIEREKVTWMTCVPAHLIRIMGLPEEARNRYDIGSLKAVLHSAAPCPRDVKAAVMEYLPPNTLWEIYGGTEGAISMISPQEWLGNPGSVGKPFPRGSEVRIMDLDGNVLPPGEPGLIYAEPMMKFRYRGAKALDKETWRGDLFTLGDIGYLDESGYLFITDRLKDMIISGGANIYPAEVEATLFNHPAVADAAVFGTPDSYWGENVMAIVELKAGSEIDGDDIIRFCRENLAHYKCPTSVEIVASLPRDPNGKVRKRELREPYWAQAGRKV